MRMQCASIQHVKPIVQVSTVAQVAEDYVGRLVTQKKGNSVKKSTWWMITHVERIILKLWIILTIEFCVNVSLTDSISMQGYMTCQVPSLGGRPKKVPMLLSFGWHEHEFGNSTVHSVWSCPIILWGSVRRWRRRFSQIAWPTSQQALHCHCWRWRIDGTKDGRWGRRSQNCHQCRGSGRRGSRHRGWRCRWSFSFGWSHYWWWWWEGRRLWPCSNTAVKLVKLCGRRWSRSWIRSNCWDHLGSLCLVGRCCWKSLWSCSRGFWRPGSHCLFFHIIIMCFHLIDVGHSLLMSFSTTDRTGHW